MDPVQQVMGGGGNCLLGDEPGVDSYIHDSYIHDSEIDVLDQVALSYYSCTR